MKRKLLFLICLLFTFFYSNAQEIDLIGKGVLDTGSPVLLNLPLTDSDNITKMDVNAIYKNAWTPVPSTTGVKFKDNDEGPGSDWSLSTNNLPAVSNPQMGYFSKIFNTADSNGIFAQIDIDYIHSFYAFIYRYKPTSLYKSYINLDKVFMYWNGSQHAYSYEIDIEKSSTTRNINVKIPITELDDDYGTRYAVIDIDAGLSEIKHFEVSYLNNMGNNFSIVECLVENVPADVESITVSIFSPYPYDSNYPKVGDSFFVSGVVVDVEKVGCTLTQGYWKTHSNCKTNGNGNGPERDGTWDQILPSAENSLFFISGQTYCDVFDTQPSKKNGKYYILAHQYIAAELNMLAGANPTDAQAAFDEATELLKKWTPANVRNSSSLESDCVRLGGILADFNEGEIGPGHCPEDDEVSAAEAIKVKEIKSKERVAIYPNPATTYGKIEFVSKQNGQTTVELYNIGGQKVGVLFNKKTKKGMPVSIEYNTEQFRKGLYFAIIKNGSDTYKEKISIIK